MIWQNCVCIITWHMVPFPFFGGFACALIVHKFSRLYTDLMTGPNLTSTELRGFHGAFATSMACQQGALPDTCFRTPVFWTCLCTNCWDQFSRTCRVFSQLFTLNIYPSVHSRFCLVLVCPFDCGCGRWESWALKFYVNHSGWMTVVAPTDHPKSVLCDFTYAMSVV